MRLKRQKQVRKPKIITVRAAPGDRRRGLVSIGPLVFPAALGRSGISSRKREGDGATPLSMMRLISGFTRSTPPATRLPLISTRSDMLWCDAPGHASYNRLVRAPFAASHEKMMRDDCLYNVCLVMNWNITSRKRNGGSAIFFHLIRGHYEPTEGCIAVSPQTMRRLLPLMETGTIVRVVG